MVLLRPGTRSLSRPIIDDGNVAAVGMTGGQIGLLDVGAAIGQGAVRVSRANDWPSGWATRLELQATATAKPANKNAATCFIAFSPD